MISIKLALEFRERERERERKRCLFLKHLFVSYISKRFFYSHISLFYCHISS